MHQRLAALRDNNAYVPTPGAALGAAPSDDGQDYGLPAVPDNADEGDLGNEYGDLDARGQSPPPRPERAMSPPDRSEFNYEEYGRTRNRIW